MSAVVSREAGSGAQQERDPVIVVSSDSRVGPSMPHLRPYRSKDFRDGSGFRVPGAMS